MASQKWFLYLANEVSGPLTTDEVVSKAQGHEAEVQVWWRGHPQWVSFAEWTQQRNALEHSENGKEALWWVRWSKTQPRKMGFDALTKLLRSHGSLEGVEVLAPHEKEWQSAFVFSQLVEDLGLSRRKLPRVPLVGQVRIEDSGLLFPVSNVSEGGVGVIEGRGLELGQQVQLTLISQSLDASVRAKAEIVFVGLDGQVGMKFVELSSEATNTLVTYIRRFNQKKSLP